MTDPFPGYEEPFRDPFATFLMTEFHAPLVEQRIRHEELRAVPGQVACDFPHGGMTVDDMEPLYPEPCPSCGAAV